jgi:hypothetical protein
MKIFDARKSCVFNASENRRGNFSKLHFGVSFGNGQRRPTNRKLSPVNLSVVDKLRADSDIQALATAASSEFQ